MRFIDIPGHEDIKARLRSLVDTEKVPHALLLEGTPGLGKFSLARAFAQYLHCENRINGDSCGRCPSCLQHQSFNHIDTIFSFPIIKKDSKPTISDDFISEFREFLTKSPFMDFEKWLLSLNNINAQPKLFVDEANELIRKLSFTTHSAKYKVVLLWLPERMNEECANKLLKLIEEPYEDTIFVMVSNNARLILPTIYSRTQRITVKRYSDNELAQYLKSTYSIDDSNALTIARIAEGNIIKAQNLVSISKESKKFLELFISLMRLAYQRKIKDLRAWSVDVAGLGREKEMQFLSYCHRLIRENFILNLSISKLNFLNPEEANFSSRFSPFINERNVLKLSAMLDCAYNDIASNANGKIVFFDLAIKTILLLKQ
jgi:DNA polymerase-3 subunit delta'